MRQQKLIATCICLLSMVSTPVFAAAGTQNNDNSEQAPNAGAQNSDNQTVAKKSRLHGHHARAASTTTTQTNTTPESSSHQIVYINGPQSFPMDVDVPGQSFVSTGPYIGVPFVYSGNDLIINSPSVNEDVTLLNMRKAITHRLTMLGRPIEEEHSHLLLSGIVEGQALYKDPGVGPNSSDIDVTNATLDGYVLGPSSWTSALFEFTYDNNIGTAEGSLNNNSRVQNSRLLLNKAFIVIGDFNKSNFYGTLGQLYVPFGTYSTSLISDPLTKILGRTKERAIVVGYHQQGDNAFYGSVYAFKGDTYVGSTNRISNYGLNAGYGFGNDKISGNFGGGVIANIADSLGMQNNGNAGPLFGGFGANAGFGNEQISHRVPAVNLRGLFSIGTSIDLIAEYISAINSFSTRDLTMNSHGAQPSALHTEAAYTFVCPFINKPSSLVVGYDKSKDGLALELPMERYSLAFNTSLWQNTLQSLELRHDVNYAGSDTATGTGSVLPVPTLIMGTGKPDNMVTAQFDIYF